MPPLIERVSARVAGAAALLCLDAGLLAFGWATVSQPTQADDAVGLQPWAAPQLDTQAPRADKARLASSDDPILMRPIFFASRRPFERAPPQTQAPAPAVKPPLPDPTLVVDGIVLTAKLRKAHLRRPTEADGQWHEAGQVVDGWTISEISGAGVVLETAGRQFPILLYPMGPRPVMAERATSRPKRPR